MFRKPELVRLEGFPDPDGAADREVVEENGHGDLLEGGIRSGWTVRPPDATSARASVPLPGRLRPFIARDRRTGNILSPRTHERTLASHDPMHPHDATSRGSIGWSARLPVSEHRTPPEPRRVAVGTRVLAT
jgi:hypothetical protein